VTCRLCANSRHQLDYIPSGLFSNIAVAFKRDKGKGLAQAFPGERMSIADWANFFIAEVGASAALAGLVVVAISINLARILSFPQLPARAAESLLMLTGALMLASLGLMPGLSLAMFGIEVLTIGLVIVVVTLNNQLKSFQPVEGLTRFKRILRAAVSVAVGLPLLVSGVLLLLGFGGGLYWAGVGVLIALAAGVWNAWVLLIEIMR
jgi:hypothetical protein